MNTPTALHRAGALLRGGGLGDLLVAQVVSVISSVVVTFVTAYFMGPEARGSLAYILGLSNLLGVIGFGSYHVGATQTERSGELNGRRAGLWAAAGSAMLIVVLGALVSVGLWVSGQSSGLVVAHATIGGALVTSNLYVMRLGQGLGRDTQFRNAWLIQGIGFAVAGSAFAAILQEPYPVVWVWWLCLISSSAYMVRILDWRKSEPSVLMRQLVRISWGAHAATLGTQVLYRFNIIALGIWSTTSDVGIYSVAAPIAEITWLVSEAFSLLAYRRALRSERQGSGLASFHLACTVAVGIVVLTLAWFLFPLVLPEFDGAVLLVAILIPGVLVQGVARVALANILGRRPGRRERFIGASAVLFALIYIPASIVGGALGVAVVSSVLYCALGAIVIAVDRHESVSDFSVK